MKNKLFNPSFPSLRAWLAPAMAVLAAVTVHAQFTLGSWQDSSDDGWVRVNGSGASLGSIYASSNDPSAFQQVTNVVAGYPESLDIKETGYGNVRAEINIASLAGGVAAWNANSNLNFTFSCGPDTGAGAGYMQLVQFQYISDKAGFNNITSGWGTNGFSETGSTGNDSSGQPVYYFYANSPSRSQVVTWNYSKVKAAIGTNPSYLNIIFVFQTGGGAPTNIYLNNVNLSGAPAAVTTSTFMVDDFSTNGVSNSNPTNDDYYSSAQNYSQGYITNVWWNWFGGAFQNLSWDGTVDANSNSASGSMKVSLNFNSANTQFVVWDQGEVNDYYALNISALTYTNFQCDVLFAPGSASAAGTFGYPIYGYLRFGTRTASYGQDWFGGVEVAATNSGWVHVSIPLNAVTDTNLLNIQGLIMGIDSGYFGLNLSGSSTFWVDNIKFVGPAVVSAPPPPVLGLQKAVPALRIFAGSSANTYDREELATTDNNQSWVSAGSGTPATYSFTLLDRGADINQTHIFLVPSTPSGQANMGNAGTPNEFIEYQASNTLWMVINPAAAGAGYVTASVQWKTNLPNSNPNVTALTITNSTAIGTWTLAFTGPSTGTLTAPGASPVSFSIADPNAAADFANPLVAYFGLQPNSTAGEGEYEDWASITVTGVSGTAENENFSNESTFNSTSQWANNSAQASSIELATTNTPYWINWTLPASGFGLGTAETVTGNTNTSNPYMLPEYYNNYGDGQTIPGAAIQGSKTWLLLPVNDLPTVDGTSTGAKSPDAFFRLFNPPLVN